MMVNQPTRLAGTIAVLCVALISTPASAQIVNNVSGEIDLMLDPFFDTGPVPTGNGDEWVWGPLEPQHRYTQVGLSDVSTSFDGDGYYSAGGYCAFDYAYKSHNPGSATFDFHATAQTLEAGDGEGGHSNLELDITLAAPTFFRFEADVIYAFSGFSVIFNGNRAVAYTDQLLGKRGTFPLIYDSSGHVIQDWGTHIDQGILPAGQYHVTIRASAQLSRYQSPMNSEGTASLTLELLGDVNHDGFVGMLDMGAVLDDWNKQSAIPGSLLGDLNHDGFVGIDDLNAVLGNWGADVRPPAAAAAAVPEPAGVTIVTLLSLTLFRRKYRP